LIINKNIYVSTRLGQGLITRLSGQ